MMDRNDRERQRHEPTFRGLAILAILALAPLAGAQATGPAAAPPAAPPAAKTATFAPASDQWHLYGGFGFGAADGKYGDVLQKPLQLDLQIAKQSASGAWRFGVGLQFGSMDPADDPNIPPETADLWLAPDKEWARLETSVIVTRVFNPRGSFRPYLQGRVSIERIHPRSELFYVQPPPEDLEPGDSPTEATNGIGFTVQPGFEIALGRTLSLDIAGFYTYYKTGSYDMSPLGLPDVDSGHEWGGRVGLAWRPFSATPRDPRPDGAARRPDHGQAAAASRRPTAARRLGRAAELGLGHGARCSRSTGAPRCSTSTCATRTSTRSARGASGRTSRRASPTTTTSSRPTS